MYRLSFALAQHVSSFKLQFFARLAMVKKRIPQSQGGPKRPAHHSGRSGRRQPCAATRVKRELPDDPPTVVVSAVKRELPVKPTVRDSGPTRCDTGTQCDPLPTEQCDICKKDQGTQCDIYSCGREELEQLKAEKRTLVRLCMTLQDELVWARGLHRDGVDAQSIRDILLERMRSSSSEE